MPAIPSRILLRACAIACLGLSACATAPEPPPPPPPPVESTLGTLDDLAGLPALLADDGQRSTLLVLAVDETLLTSDAFFGSDAWVRWQGGLPAGDRQRVPCRWDVLALAHEAGTQRATQADAPAIVNAIGIDTLLLTGRSPGARAATVRELEHAGYRLPDPLDGRDAGMIWDWRADISAQPVTVSYHQGLFMVEGQDKGALLLDLLERLDLAARYQRVVMVDDDGRNLRAVQSALRGGAMSFHGAHYLREGAAAAPDRKQLRQANDGWKAWRTLLKGVFPQRLQRLDGANGNGCGY